VSNLAHMCHHIIYAKAQSFCEKGALHGTSHKLNSSNFNNWRLLPKIKMLLANMYIISSSTQIGFWSKEVGWTNWYHKSQLWASMWCKSLIEPLLVSFPFLNWSKVYPNLPKGMGPSSLISFMLLNLLK
jgi:hypothetical protein